MGVYLYNLLETGQLIVVAEMQKVVVLGIEKERAVATDWKDQSDWLKVVVDSVVHLDSNLSVQCTDWKDDWFVQYMNLAAKHKKPINTDNYSV